MWKRWENRGLAIRFATRFAVGGSLVFFLAGIGVYWLAQETARVGLQHRLARVADQKVSQVEAALDDRLKQPTVLSRMPDVARFLSTFVGVPIRMVDPIEYETRHAALRTVLKDTTGYADLMLLSPQGELLFSIGRSVRIGNRVVDTESDLSSVWGRAVALLQPQRSGLTYDFSRDRMTGWSVAPVVRGQAMIGAVVLRMPPDLLDRVVLDLTDLGETGEAILVVVRQNRAFFLTPTRHDRVVRHPPVQIGGGPGDFSVGESISGRSGFGPVVDYRGVAVTALWRPLPAVTGGLVVKIDLSETEAPMIRLKQGLLWMGGAISLLLIGIGWFMARPVVRPITDLTRMAKAIGEGRFSDTTALEGAVGEMHSLAEMLQAMSAQIQTTYREAAEKTQALIQKVDEMEAVREGMRQEIARLQVSETHLSSIGITLKSGADALAKQIKRQADALSDANIELAHFAKIATHDLQEPLRTIGVYTQMLSKRYKGRLDSNADGFIDYVTEGVGRMRQTLTDLADYADADAESGIHPVAFCDAGSLLQGVLSEMQQVLHLRHEAAVSYDSLPTITADPEQISKLFRHLIENALKFSNGRSPKVHVGVEVAETEWIFSVTDNGIGIEPQYFDRIFQSFQKLHPIGKYSGSGVGLAVCKRIVSRHQGKIWVESVIGEGSTFKFSLPRVGGGPAVTV